MRDPELDLLLENLRAAGITKELTAEQAAKRTFEAVKKTCKEVGLKPEIECLIRKPGEERYFNDTTCWVVAWESGPYEWGIVASLSDIFPNLVEPWYSFDLTFIPSEWAKK